MRTLREWVQRLLGTLGMTRRDSDLEEELRLHLELAAEDARRRGETPDEAARAARLHAGGVAQAMESVRDQRALPWLDALAADVVFGWRQLRKRRTSSLAAIASLGLAIGATTAAFRLVDAVLLRPLPIEDPDRVFGVAFNRVTSQGEIEYRDEFDYPTFRRYREAASTHAHVLLIGAISPQEIAFAGDDSERAYRQYFSGNVFPSLGLRPALGRLLGPSDDEVPGGHPVAVISYEYWRRRFGRDPNIIGRTFRWGNQIFEVVGVGPQGFTGTEPGRAADFFAPAVMNADALDKAGWSWFRIWVRPAAGVGAAQVRQMLQPVFLEEHRLSARTFPPGTSSQRIEAYLAEQLQFVPVGSGASNIKRNLRRPLLILTALVTLVLLIACANVANLLGAQSVARAQELAVRISIGAGRSHLIRLVFIESALLAVFASLVGALFAWRAVPFVLSLLTLPQPLRLAVDVDWRVLAFAGALTAVVAFLLGLAPLRRTMSVEPLSRLRGMDRSARRYSPGFLIGVQMAFCVFVLFVSGLLVTTFDNLSSQPLGFSTERLLVLEVETGGDLRSPREWVDLPAHVRAVPGVDSAALAGWAPLTGNRWTASVRVEGRAQDRPPYFLDVSPAYFDTMHMAVIAGRDFQPGEAPPMVDPNGAALAGVGIVNQTFARMYFDGESPIGKRVLVGHWQGGELPMEIVGVVRDAVYRSVREPVPPTVYVPLDGKRNRALFVRTVGDPTLLVPNLRREVSRLPSEFRVSNVTAMAEFVNRDIVLERLLALLSSFFAVVALLLSAIGLYAVLSAVVAGRTREVGIRIALGARTVQIASVVTGAIRLPLAVGLVVGLGGALAFGGLIERLLFQVSPGAPASFVIPLLTLVTAVVVAALPPTLRAIRVDPALTLRSE